MFSDIIDSSPLCCHDAHSSCRLWPGPPQVEHGPQAEHVVQFGARTYLSQSHRLATSFPGPGEYLVEVQVRAPGPGPARAGRTQAGRGRDRQGWTDRQEETGRAGQRQAGKQGGRSLCEPSGS